MVEGTKGEAMSRKHTLWVLSLAAISIWACSSQKSAENTPPPPVERPQFETSDTVTAHVQVIAVDKTSRLATLRRDVGDTVTVQVGPEVKNFDQLAAGDLIDVVYTDKLSIRVEPPGEMTSSDATTMKTANPGEKPAGSIGQTSETTATITEIDTTLGTATLTDQVGNAFVVTPQHPENLQKVKVGDLVVFTHTEEVAMSVRPAKKK
jgi:hypothetical protein